MTVKEKKTYEDFEDLGLQPIFDDFNKEVE
jgi:hypothetical protein